LNFFVLALNWHEKKKVCKVHTIKKDNVEIFEQWIGKYRKHNLLKRCLKKFYNLTSNERKYNVIGRFLNVTLTILIE